MFFEKFVCSALLYDYVYTYNSTNVTARMRFVLPRAALAACVDSCPTVRHTLVASSAHLGTALKRVSDERQLPIAYDHHSIVVLGRVFLLTLYTHTNLIH